MKQTPITIITEILPEYQQRLEEYLAPIGNDIKNNNAIRFSAYKNLHYCAFFIIPEKSQTNSDKSSSALLVFEANIDGGREQFIGEIIQRDPSFINTVYRCCKNYPGDNTAKLTAYLIKNDYKASAFYVAHPGLSRNEIYQQNELRQRLQIYIDANRTELCAKNPSTIHADIAEKAGVIEKPKSQSFLNRKGSILFKILLVTSAIFLCASILALFGPALQLIAILILIAGLALVIILRAKEKRDKQDDTPWVPSEQMAALFHVEDRQLQNHLTSVTEIKPGWFRLNTLRIVLFFISLIAKLVATKGNLGGIVTIHFARWVILPDKKRLLFMSNYDGAWEHYLGEFIDHASTGLTAIWSNTQLGIDRGFPDTEWLALRGGSRDEQRFKTYVRNSQISELIWYSAYVDLTVKNIANNRRIHEGVFCPTDLPAWLKCF